MLLAALLGVAAGALLPVQTAVNTRLSASLRSTFLASLVSFGIGTVFLAVVVLVLRPSLAVGATLAHRPWWIWIGGLCGVVFLTLNMVLMRRLGASVTVVLPVLGQVLGGLLIDLTGAFGVAVRTLTVWRVLGTLLVVVGAVLVNLSRRPGPRTGAASGPGAPASRALPLLAVAAVLAGGLSAVQTTVNGELGKALGSSIGASLASFLVGTVALVVLNAVLAARGRLVGAGAWARPPWWGWSGGLLGATFVAVNALDAPLLGTSLTVSVVLLGQIVAGLVVDHTGALGAMRRPLTAPRLGGAVLVLAGILAVRLGG